MSKTRNVALNIPEIGKTVEIPLREWGEFLRETYFNKQSIRIATTAGGRKVRALVYEFVAVHRGDSAPYTLTHIPSGYKIFDVNGTRHDAIGITHQIVTACREQGVSLDFTDPQTSNKAENQRFVRIVKHVLSRWPGEGCHSHRKPAADKREQPHKKGKK